MGQYFQIINIDRCESLGGIGKLGEGLPEGAGAKLLPHLIVPPNPCHEPRLYFPNPYRKTLPTSWAGERIICVGDYGTDFPEGLLADWEVEEALDVLRLNDGEEEEEEAAQEAQEKEVQGTGYGQGRVNLYNVAEKYGGTPREIFPFLPGSSDYPSDQVWILRNLTKRECVRADAIALKPATARGPYVGRERTTSREPGLGDVLLSRISWSSDDSAAMSGRE